MYVNMYVCIAQNLSSVTILNIMYKRPFTIDTNYQKIHLHFYLPSGEGKNTGIYKHTVQLSEGAKYHIFTRHKVLHYCKDVA